MRGANTCGNPGAKVRPPPSFRRHESQKIKFRRHGYKNTVFSSSFSSLSDAEMHLRIILGNLCKQNWCLRVVCDVHFCRLGGDAVYKSIYILSNPQNCHPITQKFSAGSPIKRISPRFQANCAPNT